MVAGRIQTGDLMDAETLVKEHFAESVSTKQAAATVLAPAIARAGQLMAQSLLDDGKIFSCGKIGRASCRERV